MASPSNADLAREMLGCSHDYVGLASIEWNVEGAASERHVLLCKVCRTHVIPGPGFAQERWPVPEDIMWHYFGLSPQ